MPKPLRTVLLVVVAAGAGTLGVWGFLEGRSELDREREREKPVKAPPRVAREGGLAGPDGWAVVVSIDAETQKRIGLATASPRAATHVRTLTAYGALEEDPSRSFVLRAPVAGILRPAAERTWPMIGELPSTGVVGRLEPRFTAKEVVDLAAQAASARAEVANAQAAVESARADQRASDAKLTAAKSALARMRDANKDHMIDSEVVLQEAESRAKVEEASADSARARVGAAEARVKSARETLVVIEAATAWQGQPGIASLLVAGAKDPSGWVPVAIEGGFEVVEVSAHPGEVVNAGQALLRLARFDRLLARVRLPAGDSCPTEVEPASWSCQRALVIPVGREDHPLAGTLLAPVASTEGPAFLFAVDAAGSGLRPGAAVTALLGLPGDAMTGVVIPREAVVRHLGKAWAYVQVADAGRASLLAGRASLLGRFSRREVPLDAPTDDGWFAPSSWLGQASGFGVQDALVVAGAQLLLSEELKSQIRIGEEGE